MAALLRLIFFLSGGAALLFETLWFHQAGLTLGNSVWASSLVLAGFMGGLALGNGITGRLGHRVQRPLRVYAFLEMTIALTGVGLVHLLPLITPLLAPLLRPFLDDLWILNGLRLSLAFGLLLVPSTAMGATLPMVVAALFRADPHFGRVLGRLYGWNTLGAVLGAAGAEMALVGWLGIRGTALVAASLNGVAAVVALGLSRRLQEGREREPVAGPPAQPLQALSARALSLLAAAFVCGGIVLALEVIWFRFLLLFVLGSSLAFALMLSVVLTGIGLGGLAGAGWLSRRPGATRHLPGVAFVSGAVSVFVYVLFDEVAGFAPGPGSGPWAVLKLALPLMFPVSLLSGVLFTLLGQAIYREASGETRAAGFLALANTAGAMLGSLAGGFLLLPHLGIEQSIRWLAACYGAAGVLMIVGGRNLRPALALGSFLVPAGVLAALLVFFPTGLMENTYLRYPIERFSRRDNSQVVEIREGLTQTIIYMRTDQFGEPLYYRLVTNRHSMSSTDFGAQRYMKLYVYLPMALHPAPRNALLISYGAGTTAKALVDTRELETIDVVDISKEILDMSRIVYPNPREHPLEDPRVTVHVEDGRHFLQTTDRRFDLITGEPPPPKMASVVNLYTKEYFQLLYDRLAEGGMVTYWLPAHGLLVEETKAVMRAFCDAFEDCSLWTGYGLDWMLVGTRGARGPVSEERFRRQWGDPTVGPALRSVGLEVPEQLGALFMAGSKKLRQITRGSLPVEDDHPKRISGKITSAKAGLPSYSPWMDTVGAQRDFLESEFVARLWPAGMKERSVAYFPYQQVINDFALAAWPNRGERFPALHEVLSQSDLETLPLWVLGSQADSQRATRHALQKGRRGPALHYQLALGALASRHYEEAVRELRVAGGGRSRENPLACDLIYALVMAGRHTEATELASKSALGKVRDDGDRACWEFLTRTFPFLRDDGSS